MNAMTEVSAPAELAPIAPRKLQEDPGTSQLLAAPGPQGPQPGIPAAPGPRMGTCPAPVGYLYVAGVHGGAGETTVATWAGARATAGRWPVGATWSPTGQPSPDGSVVDVVLVARTHAAGLTAARTALTHSATGALPPVRLHGLVLIPDAPGRLPKPLLELAHIVAGGAPRAWLLPWLDHLRLLPTPAGPELALPRPITKFVDELQALVAATDSPAPPTSPASGPVSAAAPTVSQ